MATSRARSWIRLALPALVGATLAAGASDASAYSVKKTGKGELVHWDARDVNYSIDSSVEANVAFGADAVRRAMESWSGSVGAPALHPHDADEGSPAQPGFDRKNGVFFIAGGYAPAGRALAITVLTYDKVSGKILDADVVFNGSYRFAVLGQGGVAGGATLTVTDGVTHADVPTGEPATVYDLHHVIAHEAGHSLGMSDELERKDALMYRYTAANDATLRRPAPDDISGLAELYATNLEARGSGCGGATVAPKEPSLAAQHAAVVAALGLLVFLVLRARSDRRARLGFVLAAAAAAVTLMPSVSRQGGEARAGEVAPGHARARVFSTKTTLEDGLMRTTYELATSVCRAASCPGTGRGVAWGGQIDSVRQEVGGQFAPADGDEVDVSFARLPGALAPLSSPLGSRESAGGAVEVRVLTAAQ